ncbi:HNH endonuclease signature motif containing protein [Agromyces sp. LHK192]|uniref:HNH endonuclease n=1 Tax=Agromyces sp. LHK192 TaxID=2498704 RepID=UPI000FD7CF5A
MIAREAHAAIVAKVSAEVSEERKLYSTACRGCGVVFDTHLSLRRYCSSDCQLFFTFAKSGHCYICNTEYEQFFRIGGQLGYEFAAEHLPCRVRFREEHPELVGCDCPPCRDVRGLRPKHRKSPPKNRRPQGYRKHRPAVLERDNHICHLCKLPTDPDAHPLDDTYPVLDHDHPHAWGGSDDIENLRTAHRWCNETLSDSLESFDRIRPAAHARLRPILEAAGLLDVA